MSFNLNFIALRKYRKITQQVLNLEADYKKLSDNQLKDNTRRFREQLQKGATTDDIVVEAFATAREADFRILGMRPFENQVLGAVMIHFGNVAEMKTGEGKTLTATMPMYLNGLAGPGAFLITANPYLANRDAEEIGKVYEWLGETVTAGVGLNDDDKVDGKVVYGHDIVYTTNSQIGFDYLIDNLADSEDDRKQREFRFALIDEVDSVLLDTAQTPLVISGAPKVQSNLFMSADKLVKSLVENHDYEISEDTKSSWFTATGIEDMETYLGISELLSEQWSDMYRHLVLALRANTIMHINRDYVVDNNEVYLLDTDNGRELEGMKLEAGMHQALEAKEDVPLSDQTRSMASITYQNLFKMFTKLSGMTGTALTAAHEFMETYNLPVLPVPTHKPNIRIDHPDIIYSTMENKINAVIDLIKETHAKKRPMLVETGSVSLSRLYSRLLLREGIVHNVLNAQSAAKEALIVAEAGQPGAVTIATSMAGRGTDIKLGPGVAEMGGLLVIGTERMDNQRIDDQLRGRSGRQGDPGESVFFASLDDKIVIENAPDWMDDFRRKTVAREAGQKVVPLKSRRVRKIINRAQKDAENNSESGRTSGMEYDEVLKTQRDIVYAFRNKIMKTDQLDQQIQLVVNYAIKTVTKEFTEPNKELTEYVINNVDYNYFNNTVLQKRSSSIASVEDKLNAIVKTRLEQRTQALQSDFQMNYLRRLSILKALDTAWVDQVDNLQQLKSAISNRSAGMHNGAYEYERDAKRSFERMKQTFWKSAVKNMCLSELVPQSDGSVKVEFP
ncbi:accessory Sec system translocase SecA2 [Furfurilactobacillus siliginis]|uniref:Protein translocase subunit SecA n=1 Tax=Furfurilactobacillus siliginis TaxID=348151 RepID=A0A0R2L2N7_9LACO|nr:accessory Sec system translocase SecA2 [Furfurilactobacillus siliginis]KRN94117.1 preprotein translocase subunit SecA [Furfurilactobacillus siliginis]GEK29079.1 protein translocase subunit SecA 2 [Furfurilactobacillus siliginis]